jgi:predicted transposase YbfD/YdcC
VLGQVAVDTKSNEIPAIPKVLQLLDVSGALVSSDAMGCQKEIAATIRAGGGDYVLSVKDNQPHLLEAMRQCFERGLDTDCAGVEHRYHEECYRGHGREDRHCVHTILNPEGIRDQALWQDLRAITVVFSERQELGKGKTEEVRYDIGSRAAQAKAYGNSMRSQGGIENGLQGVLDVCFDEDRCRMRTEHSPENLAWSRRLAWCLLKRQGGQGSIRGKRLQGGWNDESLLEILNCKG